MAAERNEGQTSPVSRDRSPDLKRLEAAGVYDPSSPNAQDRLDLLTYLFEGGSSEDKLIEVYTRRGITGLIEDLQATPDGMPGDLVDVFLSRERVSARQVAERLDVDVDLVVRVRIAMGFRDGDVEAPVIPGPFVDDMTAAVFAIAIFGEDSVFGLIRVLGSAAARLAETAQSMMFGELAGNLVERPGGELAVMRANQEATAALPTIPKVFSNVFFEHVNHAANQMRGGYRDRIDMATLDLAVTFIDLVSSTEWTASLPRAEHAAALATFERMAANLATNKGCRVIKMIGDEVMAVGFDPAVVCEFAAELCAAVTAEARLPTARGGVSYGTVTPREGDYFGPSVNVAARCVKEAEPGEVVVTESVVRACSSSTGALSVTPLPPRRLRGVDEDLALFVLEP